MPSLLCHTFSSRRDFIREDQIFFFSDQKTAFLQYPVDAIEDSGPYFGMARCENVNRSAQLLNQSTTGRLISNRLLCLSGAPNVDLEASRQKEEVKL